MMGYLFALFVNAGIIKSLFGEYLILDLTVLSFSAILFLLALQVLIGQRKLRNIFDKNIGLILVPFLLFVIFLLYSSLYTVSPEFFKDKLFMVVFLTIPSFLIPAAFFNLRDIKKFIIATVLIYCIIILYSTYLFSIHGSRLLYIGKEIGTNYLKWGSFFASASLLFVGILQEKIGASGVKKIRIKDRSKLIAFSIFTVLLLFITGSRGPIIFFIICFICMTLGHIKRKRLIPLILATLVIFIIISPYLKNIILELPMPGRSERIIGFISDKDKFFSGITSRTKRFSKAWNFIIERPILGYGIGSYSYITYGDDKRDYPHNLLLEIWFENGLIPTLMFSIFLFSIMYMAIKRTKKLFVNTFLWVNIYFILSLMKSSSLTDARVFFAYLGILFAALFCSVKERELYNKEAS